VSEGGVQHCQHLHRFDALARSLSVQDINCQRCAMETRHSPFLLCPLHLHHPQRTTMKSNPLCFLLVALAASHSVFATGQGQESSSRHQPLIDFFAKERQTESGRSAMNYSIDQRGKGILQHPSDLDLSLKIGRSASVDDPASDTKSTSAATSIERRYSRYAWQRQLNSDVQVEEIYRIIGSRWRAMPKATLANSMDTLDRRLERDSGLTRELLKGHNKEIVEKIAKETGPNRVSLRRKDGQDGRALMEVITIEELLARRKAIPRKVRGMSGFKLQQRPPPKWGARIPQGDRNKLVERLADAWLVTPSTVRSTLYSIDPDKLERNLAGVLNDDPQVYLEHAKRLNPAKRQRLVGRPYSAAAPFHVQEMLAGEGQEIGQPS
jgi:hypothetical protein